jgi:hypothetical protein
MLAFKIACPNCGAKLRSSQRLPAGKRIKCLQCGVRFPTRLGDRSGLGTTVRSARKLEETEGRAFSRFSIITGGLVGLLLVGVLILILVTSANPNAPVARDSGHSSSKLDQPSSSPASKVPVESTRREDTGLTAGANGKRNLGREVLDQWTAYAEWLLDVSFTKQQREQFQEMFRTDWQKLEPSARAAFLSENGSGLPSQLPRLSNYQRDLKRNQRLTPFLASLQSSDSASASWLLGVYKAAHRRDGERNPVLVLGEPALTLSMVNQYGDFLEWVLDLKHRGGLTKLERNSLRDIMVDEWKTMEITDKDGFLSLLDRWRIIALLNDAERTKHHERIHSEFLSQLRNRADDEPSQWLLAIHDEEQELRKLHKDQ